MKKIYKKANISETETTVNVLYGEKILSIYTNKVELQRELNKVLGEPKKEYIKGRSIIGSSWEVPLKDKIKIFKFKRKTKENENIEDDILAEDNLDEFESGIINWTSEKRDMENKAEVKKSTISNEMDDYYID